MTPASERAKSARRNSFTADNVSGRRRSVPGCDGRSCVERQVAAPHDPRRARPAPRRDGVDVDGRARRSAPSTWRSATPARPCSGSPSRARSRSEKEGRKARWQLTDAGPPAAHDGHQADLRVRRRRRRLGRPLARRAVLGARGAAGEAPPAAQRPRLRRVRLPRPGRRRLPAPRPRGRRPTPCWPSSACVPGAVVFRAETGEPRRARRAARAGRGTSTRLAAEYAAFVDAFGPARPRSRRGPVRRPRRARPRAGGGSR